MKRIMMILSAVLLLTGSCVTAITTTATAGVNLSQIRQETRFLTDKMAYELNLSTPQYNDVYEINFDFLCDIESLARGVARGDGRATDLYYECLDLRNEDLRWVLSNSQYRRFMHIEYFYRPVYAEREQWHYRVYITYTNHNLFYFNKPVHYNTYRGEHHSNRNRNNSYYQGRHSNDVYKGPIRVTRPSSDGYDRRNNANGVNNRDNNRNNTQNNSRNNTQNNTRNDSPNNTRTDRRNYTSPSSSSSSSSPAVQTERRTQSERTERTARTAETEKATSTDSRSNASGQSEQNKRTGTRTSRSSNTNTNTKTDKSTDSDNAKSTRSTRSTRR